MDEFFSVKAAPNGKALCIGPLTRSEAPEAVDAGLGSGMGIYLYLAADGDGMQPIDVLAKVANQEAASVLSRLLAFQD